MARDLTITIKADDQATPTLKRVDSGIQNVTTHSGEATDATNDWQKAVSGFLLGDAGLRAMEKGVSNLMGLIKDSVGAFGEQEAAVSRLAKALENQGTLSPQVLEMYTKIADKFQDTTKFSDELILSIEGTLAQIGNVLPGQMEAAVRATLDFAAATGRTLPEAVNIVARSMSGHTEALGRVGVAVDKTKAKTDPLTATIDALNAKFGGAAQQQLQTYEGQVAHLGNQWGEFQEKIGKLVLPILTKLLTAFEQLSPAWQTFVFGLAAFGVVFGPLLTGLGLVISAFGATGLMGALAAIVPYLGPAGIIAAGVGAWIYVFQNLDVIVWAMRQVFDGVIYYAKAIYDGVKQWLVDAFHTGIVAPLQQELGLITGFFKFMAGQVVTHSIVPDMVTAIGAEISKLDGVMVSPVQAATAGVTGAFQQMGQNVIATFSTMGEAAKAAAQMVADSYAKAGFIQHPIISAGANYPGRATGGPVGAGRSYVVGERGPELFTPSSNGRITPSGGGGLSISIVVNGDVQSEQTVRRLADQVASRIMAKTNQYRPATLGKA